MIPKTIEMFLFLVFKIQIIRHFKKLSKLINFAGLILIFFQKASFIVELINGVTRLHAILVQFQICHLFNTVNLGHSFCTITGPENVSTLGQYLYHL